MVYHDWAEKKEMLPYVRFLKTDAAEAEILTGLTDRAEAAKVLYSWGAKEILITHNTEVLVYDGHEIYTCPIKARNLSGRTGRGDTTFAGYINERLTSDIPTALRFATALVFPEDGDAGTLPGHPTGRVGLPAGVLLRSNAKIPSPVLGRGGDLFRSAGRRIRRIRDRSPRERWSRPPFCRDGPVCPTADFPWQAVGRAASCLFTGFGISWRICIAPLPAAGARPLPPGSRAAARDFSREVENRWSTARQSAQCTAVIRWRASTS